MESISELIKNMGDWDKDKRYMAACDLTQIIMTYPLRWDEKAQAAIVTAFMKQLEDQSIDVQSNAVKCLSKVVVKLSGEKVDDILNTLSLNMLQSKESGKTTTEGGGGGGRRAPGGEVKGNVASQQNVQNVKNISNEYNQVYLTCLKRLIADVYISDLAFQNVSSKMLGGLRPEKALQTREECCDIMTDLIRRFPDMFVDIFTEKETLISTLDSILSSQYVSLRKKAIACLADLSSTLSDNEFRNLLRSLIAKVTVEAHEERSIVYLQTIAAVSRNAGRRIAAHMEDIVPLFISLIQNALQKEAKLRAVNGGEIPNDSSNSTERNENIDVHMEEGSCNEGNNEYENNTISIDYVKQHELIECCLDTINTFLIKSPAAAFQKYLPTINLLLLRLLSYDSNCYYGEESLDETADKMEVEEKEAEVNNEDDTREERQQEDDDEYDEEDEDEFMDEDEDDDTSWKVRRAALKLLNDEILVSGSTEKVVGICEMFAMPLIRRFKDRDFNVKSNVFDTFAQLVRSSSSARYCIPPYLSFSSLSSCLSGNCPPPYLKPPFSSSFSPSPPSSSPLSSPSSSPRSSALFEKKKNEIFDIRPKKKMKVFAEPIIKATPFIINMLIGEMKVKLKRIYNGGFSSSSSLNKTRVNIMHLLCEIATAMSEHIEKHLYKLKHVLIFCLNNPNSSIRYDALRFIQLQAKTCKDRGVYICMHGWLLPIIVKLIDDPYYKISSQALKTLSAFIRAVRSQGEASAEGKFEVSVTSLENAFVVLNKKLTVADIDQEVKQQAIKCFGYLTAHLGDMPEYSALLDMCMNAFLERLKVEVTRRIALGALKVMCASRYKYDLSKYIEEIMKSICTYIGIQNRTLKQLSLEVTSLFIFLYPTYFQDIQHALPVLNAASGQVFIEDSIGCSLSLMVICQILQMQNDDTAAQQLNQNACYVNVLKLSRSSMLQGACLQSLISFWSEIAKRPSIFPFSSLLKDLTDMNALLISLSTPSPFPSPSPSPSSSCVSPSSSRVTPLSSPSHTPSSAGADIASLTSTSHSSSKNVLFNISKCLSAILCSLDDHSVRDCFIHDSVTSLNTLNIDQANHLSVQLNVLTVGEVGKRIELSDKFPFLFSVVLKLLSSPHEDVRTAAALALGNATAGSLKTYLKMLIDEIEKSDKNEEGGIYKRHYLLLTALKQTIALHYIEEEKTDEKKDTLAEHLKPHIPKVLGLLYENSDSEEELQLSIISECFGYLLLVDKEATCPFILQMLNIKSANGDVGNIDVQNDVLKLKVKIIIALLSLRHAAQKNCDVSVFEFFRSSFFNCQKHKDIHVRRAFLSAVNAMCIHPKTSKFIEGEADNILKNLFGDIDVKTDYIREVDLGPFKHKIDDAIPLRKIAFQTVSVFVKIFAEQIDRFIIMDFISKGLRDVDDIQLASCSILVDLSQSSKNAVLSGIERIIDPMEKLIGRVAKSMSTQRAYPHGASCMQASAGEYEKHVDTLRLYAKTLFTVHQAIQDMHPPLPFTEMVGRCMNIEAFRSFWEGFAQRAANNKTI